ncbi:ribose-5-phosphate isomerase [Candidatus Dependentiae bacterium]|nr:MAG: ribose-5-phosphate isomerase [Candidatus Dependentiae bacterium]
MKISIGSDHRGAELKASILQQYSEQIFFDVGTDTKERVDYPDFAHAVCQKIINHESDIGILICGTGIGMSITANRYENIYAGLCWSAEIARLAKAHDHINVLVLPADFIDQKTAFEIINTWFKTKPLDGTYAQRLEKI